MLDESAACVRASNDTIDIYRYGFARDAEILSQHLGARCRCVDAAVFGQPKARAAAVQASCTFVTAVRNSALPAISVDRSSGLVTALPIAVRTPDD
jgi:hypothetical protein